MSNPDISVEKQSRLQSILVECVQSLYINNSIDDSLNHLLEIIAGFFRADRCYIFEIDEETQLIHNTYEWCAEGVVPEIANLQEVGLSVINRWLYYFETKGEFYINSLSSDVSKDSEEYRILKDQGIDSLMAAPLRSGNKLVGFIGVDNPSENTDMLILMRLVSAFVLNDIQKRETLEQQILRAIGNSFEYINVIDLLKDTQREVKHNDELSGIVACRENAASQMVELSVTADGEYCDELKKFADISTIAHRMSGTDVLGYEYLAKNGHWCRVIFFAMTRDENGKLVKVVFGMRYIDAGKKKELEYQRALKKALENKNEIFAEMLHMQGCGVVACSTITQDMIMMNDAAKQFFHFTGNGKKLKDVLFPVLVTDQDKVSAVLNELSMEQGSRSLELAVRGKDDIIYLQSTARTVTLAGGDPIMIITFTDITDKKRLENRLTVLSETDALTQICNRGSGERKTERLISGGTSGMFCLLDVDKFKQINDSFGHMTGDKALVAVAACLKSSFAGCIVMRLGGDEFAVFAPDITTEEQGEVLIKRFFDAINSINIMEMSGKKISVSLGAVLCKDCRVQFDGLYAMADNAMYLCKNIPGNYYNFARS